MKNMLAILAVLGFFLEGLTNLYGLIEWWPGEEEVSEHVLLHLGYLAGSVAGVSVAIACMFIPGNMNDHRLMYQNR